MKLKSPTDTPIYVALLSGHTINIGPEGCDVPEMYRKEAFTNGAIPVGTSISDFEPAKDAPIDDSKLALLVTGVKKMLVENTEDFTGAGLPNRKVLSSIVGWNVSVQELSSAWAQIQDETKAPE